MLKLIKFVGMTSLIISAFLDSVENGFMAVGIISLLYYAIAFASSIADEDDAPTKISNAQHNHLGPNTVPSNIPMPPKPTKPIKK